MTLHIHQYELGDYANFVYLLADGETGDTAVVDPAWDVPFLLAEIERLGYTLTKIILTHGHKDHIIGVPDVLKAHPDLPVYLSPHETNPNFRPDVPAGQLLDLADGDEVAIGNVTVRAIHTPGHSPGCTCLAHGRELIAGDTLFIDGCGRCDLPGSDVEAQYHSLHTTLWSLPDDTRIYPGHNYGPTPTATLGQQKQSNPYLLTRDKERFIRLRMGG